jgi:hypothetical protein
MNISIDVSYIRMNIDAFITILAVGEKLALLCRMMEWATSILCFFAVREKFAFNLLFVIFN